MMVEISLVDFRSALVTVKLFTPRECFPAGKTGLQLSPCLSLPRIPLLYKTSEFQWWFLLALTKL